MITVDSTEAFKYLWYIWRIFGVHPPNDDTFWSRHYTIYSICVNIVIHICAPSAFYIDCVMSSSLTDFCESFFLAILMIAEQIKFVNSWYILGRLKGLHITLHRLDKRLQNEMEADIIRHHITYSKRIFFFFVRLLLTILVTASLHMIIKSGNELVFTAWYPWNWQSSNRAYRWTVLYQICSIYIMAIMALINDIYPVSYLTIIAGHYRSLALRISQLGHSDELQSVTFIKLTNCIEDQKTILFSVDTIQDALSAVIFYQFICTALSMCTLAFYTIFVKIDITKFLALFFIFVGVIFETYIICFAAEDVGKGAEEVEHAIYDCNWLDQSIKFQRTLILMLRRSQRPVIIRSAGFLPVRMTTFQGVVKTAYSMFTLLNQFQS